MDDNVFAERLLGMRDTMYRVSHTYLQCAADRDDAVQEALTKAWQNRRRLRDERYMQTWVTRILINECRNLHRKPQMAELSDDHAAPSTHDSGLREALMRLDVSLRMPVVLHYAEGYTTAEAAKILGIPKGTLLWRLAKARRELAALLEGDTIQDSI